LRIAFAGTPEFAVAPLLALASSRHSVVGVYTQPDRPAGRGRKITQSAVKQQATELGLACYQPETLRDEEQRQVLAALAVDVMVVVAYGQLLPEAILTIPRYGCINIHASLLPRWRGAAPIHRAILAGDTHSGVSIMLMEAGLDTGPVLSTSTAKITPDTTMGDLHDTLARQGANQIVETIEKWCSGQITAQPQDASQASYAQKISKAEATIDWRQPAQAIDAQVRAFNPWPVAHTTLGGQKLRIWETEVATQQVDVAPGTVLRCNQTALEVAAGQGSLRIKTLQLPGKKAIASADFANGNDVTGEILGNA